MASFAPALALVVAAASSPPAPRTHVVTLDVDLAARVDDGPPLHGTVALARSLRPRLATADLVLVAPGDGVRWGQVVALVHTVEQLAADDHHVSVALRFATP